MQNSRIPVRKNPRVNTKIPVLCDKKNENKSSLDQQKDKMQNGQTAATKQKPLLGKARNKNLPSKPTLEKRNQESCRPHMTDKSKSTVTRTVKGVSSSVLREQNKIKNIQSQKPNGKWQQSKTVKENGFVPSLKTENRQRPKPLDFKQIQQSSVANVRNDIENKNPKVKHPSQPDIEFVPDENCRNRILSGRELSPGILKLPFRAQSSTYRKFSLYKPGPIPTDATKALRKAMENMDSKADIEFVPDENCRNRILSGRELSPGILKLPFRAQSSTYRKFSLYKPGRIPTDATKALREAIENMDSKVRRASVMKNYLKSTPQIENLCPFPRKTPINNIENAMRRWTEIKGNCKLKSARKVTFDLPDSDSESKASSKKSVQDIDGLRRMDINGKSDLSQHFTPETSASDAEKTPTITSFNNILSMVRQQNGTDGLQNSRTAHEKPVSILKSTSSAAADCGMKDKSFNFRSRMLRRSISASELESRPSSTLAQTTENPPSKFSSKVNSGRSNQIENSTSPLLSPSVCNFNRLRTSSSSPELRVIFPAANGKSEKEMAGHSSLIKNANKFEISSQVQNKRLLSMTKDYNFKPCNKLLNSIKATETRSSLYASATKNAMESTNSQAPPKLCTPCPVSFYPKSEISDSFSPEFLCRRTSNIISHAPIRTPLVMRHLVENENDQLDNDLGPVRQKLDFETFHKETEIPKVLSRAYLQTFRTPQIILDSLADEECGMILSHAEFPFICSQDLSNPIAKTLEYGDEMHFVPVVLP